MNNKDRHERMKEHEWRREIRGGNDGYRIQVKENRKTKKQNIDF